MSDYYCEEHRYNPPLNSVLRFCPYCLGAEAPAPEADSTSETPRTDAAIKESDGQWSFALRDVSRQLERELAKAIKELEKKQAYWLAELDAKLRTQSNLDLATQQLATAKEALGSIGNSFMPSVNEIQSLAKQALAAIKPAPPMSDK